MTPEFSKHIIEWYKENQRALPWRLSADPYKIWLSEVILQQTRVAQGLPYYIRFVEIFPTVFHLAQASQEKVLKLWQGLGYYSRARNLHQAAKTVVNQYNGVFPDTYKELKKLKGVGDYTASAVASMCFDEPVAVLDGNVFRVLSRFFGIDLPINTTAGKKVFKTKAEQGLNRKTPGQYNQAIMEFGALQCKPKKPHCVSCPLQKECVAFQQGKTDKLPVKLKKTKVRKRYLNYMVFVNAEKKTILQQRLGRGIWKNLYEFPLLETEEEVDKAALLKRDEFSSWEIRGEQLSSWSDQSIKHLLSHQKLMIKFWLVKVVDFPQSSLTAENRKCMNWEQVAEYPVPVVIEKFLNKIGDKA